jgi:hypothetical protein
MGRTTVKFTSRMALYLAALFLLAGASSAADKKPKLPATTIAWRVTRMLRSATT